MTIEKTIQDSFHRFAEVEVGDSSPELSLLASSFAESERLVKLLSALPRSKRQPNLVLAAIRYLAGAGSTPRDQIEHALDHWEDIHSLILSRDTQTNEAGRCATLLPFLADFPQPLSLIEVGAAAGLCLLPDHYQYSYNDGPSFGSENGPLLRCSVEGEGPVPDSLPEVIWRRGLERSPIDLQVESSRRWLETLVWPGQTERLERLTGAIEVARQVRPKIHKGDLRTDLITLIKEAPKDSTVVVFHTAVLAYVEDQTQRDEFAEAVRNSGAVWISNEAPSVFPTIRDRVSTDVPSNRFVLSVNGEPVAFTGTHGQSINWI